jgi:hypothetical protein
MDCNNSFIDNQSLDRDEGSFMLHVSGIYLPVISKEGNINSYSATLVDTEKFGSALTR